MKIYSGGPLSVPEKSLGVVLFDTVKKNPDRPAVKWKPAPGRPFESADWKTVYERVRAIGNGLLSLGIEPGDRVAILSESRVEWMFTDYAILSIGGIVTTVYPTLTAEQIAYLLNDSGSRVLFVENANQWAKIEKVAKDIKTVETFVTFEDVKASPDLAKRTHRLADLVETGQSYARANAGMFDQRRDRVKSDDIATLVYTSGTTGTPKGAILTHKNFYAAALAAIKQLETQDFPRFLAFLPLAHCYGRLAVFWMTIHAGEIAFSSPSSLGEDMRNFKPTYLVSVPRLYERMYDQIMLGFAQMPAKRQNLLKKATETAKEYGRALSDGGRPPLGLRLRHALYDRLVYSKLRARLGFEDFVLGTTGAAAIRPELLYFFQGIGVNILEGYGLTETAAPSNVNRPRKFKPGSVGPPFAGMEQALAEDGEILMKGPNIFKGYWNIPGETNDAFTEDGWFRTGDIGVFDGDGYLKIVDRKKELEVLDTGKKIAPVTVEEKLKESPYISEGMLVATGQKFAGALIVPNFDNLLRWAKENGVAYDDKLVVRVKDPTGNDMTVSVGNDLIGDLKVTKLYEGEVAKTNEKCAEFERVKVFRLIPRALTNPMMPIPLKPGEDYEMTPTLKKKRRIIAKNYAENIRDMFAGGKGDRAK